MTTAITNKSGFSTLCSKLDSIIEKAVKENINAEILHNGSVLCTAFLGNTRHKKIYYGYTLSKSKKLFLEYLMTT